MKEFKNNKNTEILNNLTAEFCQKDSSSIM